MIPYKGDGVYNPGGGTPKTTKADEGKYYGVGADGKAEFDYLPSTRFGIKSPLKFIKDTQEENVIGFDVESDEQGKILEVQKDGTPKFVNLGKKIFGVSSPLEFDEDNIKCNIVFNTRHKHHFVLQARDTSGNVEFVENVLVGNINYDNDLGSWRCDKNWNTIFEYLAYSMPVKMRVEFAQNDFVWCDVMNEYTEEVGGQSVNHIIFQCIDFCIGSNKIYVCAVDWKSDNTFTMNEKNYNPPTIYNP